MFLSFSCLNLYNKISYLMAGGYSIAWKHPFRELDPSGNLSPLEFQWWNCESFNMDTDEIGWHLMYPVVFQSLMSRFVSDSQVTSLGQKKANNNSQTLAIYWSALAVKSSIDRLSAWTSYRHIIDSNTLLSISFSTFFFSFMPSSSA